MKTIRFAQQSDAASLLSIYAPYVENSVITFEYEVPSLDTFQKRMLHIQKEYPYLVCEIDHEIVAYAYAHRHMQRAAYQWNVELSIYLREDMKRRGIGKAMYTALLDILQLQGLKTAIACITLPNASSIALHEHFGFSEFGILRYAGYKQNAWHDVVWMKKELSEHALQPQPFLSVDKLNQERVEAIFHTAETMILV